jgi:hypothetical protein
MITVGLVSILLISAILVVNNSAYGQMLNMTNTTQMEEHEKTEYNKCLNDMRKITCDAIYGKTQNDTEIFCGFYVHPMCDKLRADGGNNTKLS